MARSLSPLEVEEARGKTVLVVFRPDVNHEPLEGKLFNADPATGTVIIIRDGIESERPAFTAVYYEAIESIKGMYFVGVAQYEPEQYL